MEKACCVYDREGRGGGDGATALIHNNFKQMRKFSSNTIPFLFSVFIVYPVRNKYFSILKLQTPGKTYIPFQSMISALST